MRCLSPIAAAAILCTLVLTSTAKAEQKQILGNWDVHYIVVNTTFLTPDVAKTYDIVRSKYSALVNISVLDTVTQQAQNAALTGTATNLLGVKKSLSFRKVEEGDAIYYLATLPFDDPETFRFAIDVQQGNTTRTLKFQQKLYAE